MSANPNAPLASAPLGCLPLAGSFNQYEYSASGGAKCNGSYVWTPGVGGGVKCKSGTYANGYEYRLQFVVHPTHTITGFPVLLRLTAPGLNTTTLHFEDNAGNTLAGEYIDYKDSTLFAAVKADINTSTTTCWLYWN